MRLIGANLEPMSVIGITGRQVYATDDLPETVRHLRSEAFITAYSRAIAVAGATPVLLSREGDPFELARWLDGFVLAGGQDVDPRRYGAVPGPRSSPLDPARDCFEIDLVHAAVSRQRPLLGICRGAQLLNVAFGGSLTQDLPVGSGQSHAFLGYPGNHRSHAVDFTGGTRLAALFGERLNVNSYHHQCIDQVGEGLVIAGRAPDSVIEAIELPGLDILGVQWHPEMFSEGDPLFHWLVQQCTKLENREKYRVMA